MYRHPPISPPFPSPPLSRSPPHGQHLLAMLFRDPPCSYSEISATLGIPIGSIGPQRARCLERLRHSSALTAFGESEFSITSPGDRKSTRLNSSHSQISYAVF